MHSFVETQTSGHDALVGTPGTGPCLSIQDKKSLADALRRSFWISTKRPTLNYMGRSTRKEIRTKFRIGYRSLRFLPQNIVERND